MILPNLLRSTRALLAVLLILASAGAIIGSAWYAAHRTSDIQRLDTLQRIDATATALAANYAEQVNRQILAIDQTLELMVREYQSDPRRFNLENARSRALILNGISCDMFLADENGIIRQSSVSDFIGQSVANLDVFRDAAEHTNDKPGVSRRRLGQSDHASMAHGRGANPAPSRWVVRRPHRHRLPRIGP